ncbi:hypothetical protein DDB_G0285043 [Dictyostelium discoideum AX4]|uniref:Uncharacterized protein n=1 Tax=Dictyostelium discoideum TaxID=44689 RepID=Q54NY0_DICDI|nr:hypothetical protein DDB_G0284927 [Dictyostelium discoideum AX4]XP_639937.1 hypothetical protein DDB_G0285043 [Dictyostelium discoideum AX4]EAL64927.1 hypothetical protein DDB_G0284927 [Dictyostelium discoideum AX4]EAL64985.1 hypothetical protein DDB_G0285043 [Dictyostelium discoideum AX4]|eukprot:XP_639935.1 hypothetical protein DDB_G0284927 [Dictyostelium discoideum AX4]
MLIDALTKLSFGAGKSSATKVSSKSSTGISFGNNNVTWNGLPPPPPPPPYRGDAPEEEE